MRIKIFFFLLLLFLTTPSWGYPDSCGDDPRLASALRDLVKEPAKITPPLTITPETWLDMDTEFRNLLGGNATICPGIPVLKSGKLLRKPELEFNTLWVALRNAAQRKDKETVKWIFSNFKAKPMTVTEIVKTVESPLMTEEGQKLLCEVIGVVNNDNTLILDFYSALGGAPTDKTAVLSGKAIRADIFTDYPCEHFKDWVTVRDLKKIWGDRIPGNKIFDTLNSLGIEDK